jgi:hypothetical protein
MKLLSPMTATDATALPKGERIVSSQKCSMTKQKVSDMSVVSVVL